MISRSRRKENHLFYKSLLNDLLYTDEKSLRNAFPAFMCLLQTKLISHHFESCITINCWKTCWVHPIILKYWFESHTITYTYHILLGYIHLAHMGYDISIFARFPLFIFWQGLVHYTWRECSMTLRQGKQVIWDRKANLHAQNGQESITWTGYFHFISLVVYLGLKVLF